MTDPFLILHRVRNEPAFDIAIRIGCNICGQYTCQDGTIIGENNTGCNECDDLGWWWIIPTSGHRAHPVWSMKIEALFSYAPGDQHIWGPPPIPEGWPDHYPSRAASSINIQSVITALTTPAEPIERRF